MTALWKLREEDRDSTRLRDQDGFRIRAAGVCVRGEGTDTFALLVSGGKNGHQWVVPGGGVEKNESSEAAALRELEEEAGVRAKATALIGVFQDDERKHRTTVYLMEVNEVMSVWREGECGRRREWIKISESKDVVKNSHLPILNAVLDRVVPAAR